MVQLVKKEIEVTKECSEIFDAMAGIIADIRAQKPVSEIVGGNFGKLTIAVQGFEEIPQEVKHEKFYMTAGVGTGEIAEALLKKQEPVQA